MAISLTIPVLSEKVTQDGKPARYKVTPLFHHIGRHGSEDASATFNEREDRALEQLSKELRKALNQAAAGMDHSAFNRRGFSPDLSIRNLKLEIPLRKQTIRGGFAVVTFQSIGRKVVVLPSVPNLSFDLERGEDIQTRTTEVMAQFFKKKEKEHGEPIDVDDYVSDSYARITHLEFDIRTNQKFQKPDENKFAMLGGSERMSGSERRSRSRTYFGSLKIRSV